MQLYAGPGVKAVLETIVFLFHLLSATSKPFSSLSTRLAHAARLGSFYKNVLYKFTVIIIVIIKLGCPWVSLQKLLGITRTIRLRTWCSS